MSALHITLTLPDELAVEAAQAASPEQWALELILCQLYAEGKITTGQAARLLGVSRVDFMAVLDRRGVPFFDLSAEELAADAANAHRAAESASRARRQ